MTTMMELKKRFMQHPLLPSEVIGQQNKWRERWGLQPRSPEPSENWRYYFDPSEIHGTDPNDPRQRLRFALRSADSDRNAKYFLTGSKGAGKSTTAYSLWDDPHISRRYTLISFTIRDYLNLADTDASQVIAVMIAHLVEQLRDAKAGAALGDLEDRAAVKALNAVLKKVRPSAGLSQVNVSVFGWFTAIFKESSSAREEFRRFIDGRFDEVMGLFDELNGLLEQRTGKPTLFVVDDLDKIPTGGSSEKIFNEQLVMLLRPRCAALYSYPIEVDHDPKFDGLKRGQPNRYVLANVKLTEEPDGPIIDEGRTVMTQFVCRRLEGKQLEDLIELTPPQWDRVLHYSAGNFREMSRILAHAFEIAAMMDKPRADQACFELALRRLREDYNVFVQKYRGFLAKVHDHAGEPPDGLDADQLKVLLAAFVVVEYPNDPGWLGLNHVVADLLMGQSSTL